MIHIGAFDLSISTTGVAVVRGGLPRFWAVSEPSLPQGATLEDEMVRVRSMASRAFRKATADLEPDDEALFAFEAPSYASQYGKPNERAYLFGILADALGRRGRLVQVPPASIKSFWTHNGAASKKVMLEWTRRRFPALGMVEHNANDAFALAFMVARNYGYLLEPYPPEVNWSALAPVRWPELKVKD